MALGREEKLGLKWKKKKVSVEMGRERGPAFTYMQYGKVHEA